MTAAAPAQDIAGSSHGPKAAQTIAQPPSPSIWRWPPGTTMFALRTWLSLSLALYAAFLFELDGAASAGVCVLILAQPTQGMVLSKALYRLLGTFIGCAVALALTAAFPQDRTMLLASFAVFMAIQTAIGSILRDFRAYAAILSGYTVAIISVTTIDSPMSTFDQAVNRVAAIVCGIVAIELVNFLFTAENDSQLLQRGLRQATRDVRDMGLAVLEERKPPTAQACAAMAVRLMPLRSEIGFASVERADGRARAAGARSALLGLFEAIAPIRAVGHALREAGPPSPVVEKMRALVDRALRRQDPEKLLPELDAIALPAIRSRSLSLPEAVVFTRARYLIEVWSDVRDGSLSVRTGRLPRRTTAALPVHQDYFGVFLNALRVLVALGIVSILAIWSGWTATSQVVLFTAVFVALGGILPDPRIMGNTALFGLPAVIVIGTIYSFFVLPNMQGYPLFAVALAPIVVLTCWFVKVGMPGAGMIVGVMSIVLISPANEQTLDPNRFVTTATMLAVSGVTIWSTILLFFPVDPAKRQMRLALSVGRFLRRALADEDKLQQPRPSRFFDILNQFTSWQRGKPPNLARRKTIQRLTDLGNLAYAVRRSWRTLDTAQPYVDEKLDALARRVLPALLPDATRDAAEAYLASSDGEEDEAALAIVRAAAALYAVSALTTVEKRLLARVELLARPL